MRFLKAAVPVLTLSTGLVLALATDALAQLPDPGMEIDLENTALVLTDPQNDFLSPDGVAWDVVGVAVVSDGTAAAIVAEGDGYAAALVNFRFMAQT